MATQAEMQAIVGALARYFRSATNDDQRNADLVRGDIQRFGEALVPMGLAYVAHRLQAIAGETAAGFLFDEDEGDKQIVAQGMLMIDQERSLIGAYGEMGVALLLKTLAFTDEDTVALAAYELADRRFVRPASVTQLRQAFQTAYGSGCRLALALALYRHGDMPPFKQLAPQFLMRQPSSDPQALEAAAKSVFPVVALDIVSNGRAYSGPGRAQWTRKQY